MIRIETRHLAALNAAVSAQELHGTIQKTIELEFATIPPYLTAMMSLRVDANREIWGILHSVVIDEMIHMLINCNLLVALGGKPRIDSPQFVARYPGPLPMAIHSDLIVGLEAFSPTLVENTFMGIEKPENPIQIQGLGLVAYATIGQFYEALKAKVQQLGDGAFNQDTSGQLVDPQWFPPDRLFPIASVADAVRAIELIVREGEGTPLTPIGEPGQPAHYYRFQQIVKGHRLLPDAAAPSGFSFTGDAIPFDASTVWPITPNQQLRDLDADSQAGRRARQFAYSFTKLLKALQQTFDGKPGAFATAMGLMFELKLAGQMLCASPAVLAGQLTGKNAGPAFEYLADNT